LIWRHTVVFLPVPQKANIFRGPNHERLRAALKPAALLFRADAFSGAEKALLSLLTLVFAGSTGQGRKKSLTKIECSRHVAQGVDNDA
jgi:hypothetical protein